MAKGFMVSNWMYLLVFYFLYFISLMVIQSIFGTFQTIFSNFGGVDLWSDIPDTTWFLVNLVLYVIVPLGALAYTILASKPREVIYAPY